VLAQPGQHTVSIAARRFPVPPSQEPAFQDPAARKAPNTYNFRINDYLRAVEKALAETPPSRRRELLASLSERVEARRVALRATAEREDLLDLFDEDGFDDEVDGDHPPPALEVPVERDTARTDADHAAVEPNAFGERPAGRRVGALAWVLVVAAAMLVMCVAAALTFIFFAVRTGLHQ
jgi:hypothetical protein